MDTLPRLRPLEILQVPDEDGGQAALLRDPEGFSDAELVLSQAALFVAAHFDGEHSVEATLASFERKFGSKPAAADIERMREQLDAAYFLETPRFEAHAHKLQDAFLSGPVRSAAHAGVSYPEDPEEASAAVTRFFEEARDIEEPGPRPPGRLAGLVAPHIDLRVGGACTAAAYRLLAEAPEVDTVVVLGTGHACPHPAWVVLDKPFATPLGEVPVDAAACARLAAAADTRPEWRYYHRREHSVEFQALFLAALRRAGRDLKLVPVLCGSQRDADPGVDPFLTDLAGLLADLGPRGLVLAGADLAHVGPRFGDPEPLSEHYLRLLETKDRATLRAVAEGDATAFHASVMEADDPRRICGLSPIFGLLEALPGARGKLLRYEQAVDPTGTVTYASLGMWLA